jgi:diguanylate cyclase (GGDEF)-like protein
MYLDLPTLMAMGSFVAGCAGVILGFAWLRDRSAPELAQWAIANIVAAAGIFSLTLGLTLDRAFWFVAAGLLLALAHGLVWRAARSLDARPASILLALLGVIAVAMVSIVPTTHRFGAAVSLAAGASYMVAGATSLWLGRNDQLPARLPVIVLMVLHASVLATGVYASLAGAIDRGPVPSLWSLFGFIHFEAIVFFLGTAVFLLALVKERAEAASRAAANTDPLTGISNRAAFIEYAERIVLRCRGENAPVSVMMFDLDRFKSINDTHGHAMGDNVIRTFCDVTTALLRPGDIFGRLGGEEFAIVIAGADLETAAVRAERIRAAFAIKGRFIGGRAIAATVSAGVASSGDLADCTLDQLLEWSDTALYCAKATGRNRIESGRQDFKQRSPNVTRIA